MDPNPVQTPMVNNHGSDSSSIIANPQPTNDPQAQQSCMSPMSPLAGSSLQANNLQSQQLDMGHRGPNDHQSQTQMDCNRTATQAMSSNSCSDSRVGLNTHSRDLNIPLVRPPSEPQSQHNDRNKSAALTMTSSAFPESRMGLPRDFNIPKPFSNEPRLPRPYSVPPDPKALQPFLQANYDKSWMAMDFRPQMPSTFGDNSRSFMTNSNGPRPLLMPDGRPIPPLVSLDLSIPKPSITTSSYTPSPLLGMGPHGLRPLMSSGFASSPRLPMTSTGGNKRGRPRKNQSMEFLIRPPAPMSNGKDGRGLMPSDSSSSSSPVFPGSSSDPGPQMGASGSNFADCSAESRSLMNSLPNTPRLSNIMDVLSPRPLMPMDFTSSRLDKNGQQAADLHGALMEEKPFKCNVCGRGFVAEQSLEIHMRTHNESRPFHCEVCNQHFTQKSGLLAHMRIHTDERPFKCHVCLKAFRQQGGLTVHMRTHSGERPYKCFECGKEFTQQTGLNAHSRIHSGIRPYKCPVCNRLFTQQSGLVVHMRRHSGIKPFKCEQCGKAFAQQSGLIAHIRTHNTEKPFMCNYCQKRFKQQSSLATHLRTNHAEIPEPQIAFELQ